MFIQAFLRLLNKLFSVSRLKFSCKYKIFEGNDQIWYSQKQLYLFLSIHLSVKDMKTLSSNFDVRRRTEFERNIASYWKELKLVWHSLLLIIFYRAPPSRLITYFCMCNFELCMWMYERIFLNYHYYIPKKCKKANVRRVIFWQHHLIKFSSSKDQN